MNGSPPHRRLLRMLAVLMLCAAWFGSRPLSNGEVRMIFGAPATASAAASLPQGYLLYVSRVLPYSIGYPGGWQAQGSIFGSLKRPAGIYYDADTFTKKRAGSITIQGEDLPPGSLLTSASYLELALLELQRGKEADPGLGYTAKRLGTITIDGTQAYLLDVTRGDGLWITEALWVGGGKGWRAGLTTPAKSAAHCTLVPVFRMMLQTFHLRQPAT